MEGKGGDDGIVAAAQAAALVTYEDAAAAARAGAIPLQDIRPLLHSVGIAGRVLCVCGGVAAVGDWVAVPRGLHPLGPNRRR
jgi:hypothetical protein